MRLISAAVFAALLCACSGAAPAAPETPKKPQASTSTAAPDADLTNAFWRRTGDGAAPGSMVAFLDDGAMLMDSCWETYRINDWRRDGDSVSWTEDREKIAADIVSLNASKLVLRLHLRGGDEEQTFERADAPYLCPDMPR